MPTLNWIGKDKVVSHHQDVPYRVFEHKYGFTSENGEQKQPTKCGNKIIHGDNLEGLKSLLPEYENQIKFIYIDPPYNTGKEDWVYNDSVNHPKILKWLGDVVGKEGEDLTRHDKWLCMMYPRIQLLYKLLKEDGIIAVHIDENEYHTLVILFEEIFGKKNNLGTIIWDKKNPKGDAQKISYQHESILLFSKNVEIVKGNIIRKKKNAKKIIDFAKKIFTKIGKETYPDDILQICKKYKLDKSLFDKYKFVYDLETVNKEFAEWIKGQDFSGGEKAYKFIDKDGEVYRGVSMAWPNKKKAPDDYFIPLIHPITKKECPIPARGWRNPPSTMKKLLDENKIVFGEDETKQPERKYLLKENMFEKIYSVLSYAGSDDDFQKKIGINLENPKPYLLATDIVDWFTEKDSVVLDSFAGSGTTAHAVLKLNKEDEGNRKFILIQCDEYDKKGEVVNICEKVTATRVKRVISGYGNGKNQVESLGGSFDYLEIGDPIFKDDKNLNEDVGEAKIREYIYYTETKQHLEREQSPEHKYLLDTYNETGYYFYYEKDRLTTLSLDTLNIVTERAEQYLIYADTCHLDKEYMLAKNIIFKKIPRDIKRF
jgi:adenine-specific DNA-methyltransferase